MAPGSEWLSIYLVGAIIAAAWLAMFVGILCWFAHLRRIGATLMFVAGGSLAGFLAAGVLFLFVWYSMQPSPKRFEQTIVRDWSHIDAKPASGVHPLVRILGLVVPAAGLVGGIVGVYYARGVAQRET